MNWVNFWTDKSKSEDDKICIGRNYPNEILDQIGLDLVNILKPDSNKSILDVGGANGYFLRDIINNFSPKKACLIDASIYNVQSFKEWTINNNIKNSIGYVSILPEFPKLDEKFDIIMCGTTLGYLKSIDDVKISIKKMYDLLNNNGILLIFHHYDILSKEPNILTFDFNFFKDVSENIGFRSIEKLKVGPHYKNGCCGSNEISVILMK